jgi:NAD(P)H-flavin reductase
VIYGARNPGLLIYKDELAAWAKRDDLSLNVTVDRVETQRVRIDVKTPFRTLILVLLSSAYFKKNPHV